MKRPIGVHRNTTLLSSVCPIILKDDFESRDSSLLSSIVLPSTHEAAPSESVLLFHSWALKDDKKKRPSPPPSAGITQQEAL
jgi:hypothetical protein